MIYKVKIAALVLCILMVAVQQNLSAQKRLQCSVKQISLEPQEYAHQITTYKSSSVAGNTNVITIEVKLSPRQEMDGVGGSFNELGWAALTALPEKERQELLRNLFDVKKGAALRFNRIPVGASDFAKSAYSLDDSTNDWELKYFSVKRDEQCLIPYIKAAQQFNKYMKFHASPWSPPGWMKTNGSQTNGGELLSDDRTLQSHANYLVKFLQAYQLHNIHINRLCPQNEPLVAGNYPGCKIPAPLYAKAVRDFIVPAVESSGLNTEVWAGTFNYWRADTRSHFDGLMNEKEMIKKVNGFSFQYSNMKWLKEFIQQYPGKPLQFSESECYNGKNSLEEVLRDFQDFAAYTRAGTKLFTFWNIVLPEPHKSTWGWKQNSLVVIDTATKKITYEPSYAMAKMIGSEIEPGDKYVPATITNGHQLIGALHYKPADAVNFMETDLDNGEQVVAFMKKNGKLLLLLYNHGEEVKANIVVNKQQVKTVLPARKLIAVEVSGATK